jgi:hypothetical protein
MIRANILLTTGANGIELLFQFIGVIELDKKLESLELTADIETDMFTPGHIV